MSSRYKTLAAVVWLTQFALSVISPLVLSILLAVWLRDRFGIGDWVVALGVLAGLGGAVSGFISSLRSIKRLGEGDGEKKPPAFNDHE